MLVSSILSGSVKLHVAKYEAFSSSPNVTTPTLRIAGQSLKADSVLPFLTFFKDSSAEVATLGICSDPKFI
jgi:hypothetical protein